MNNECRPPAASGLGPMRSFVTTATMHLLARSSCRPPLCSMPDVLTLTAHRARPASHDDALSDASDAAQAMSRPGSPLVGTECTQSTVTPSVRALRALTAAHLALLEADRQQVSLPGPRAARLRRAWVRIRARLLRPGRVREAREQALRALTFWELSLVSRPQASNEARAQWCARYALAGCPPAQRTRLMPGLALALLRTRLGL